ncbi:MAG: sulfurtransferase [Acidimicrobiia bacterium]|nr:MAG: sulfurtransferase [Acidimicrobiia bacterium]
MTPNELVERLDDPDLVIVDCRWYLTDPDAGHHAYSEGHLPGALYASLDDDLSGAKGPGRHPLPTPEAFGETCAALGITESTTVVAYDDSGGAVASRLWWMLMNQGHRRAFVLDGGIQAWTNAGGSITGANTPQRTGGFATKNWSRTVDRGVVANRSDPRIVIDARSRERYRGQEEAVDPKAGHIPGALSMPLTDNLNDDLTLLPADTLKQRFEAAGITDAELVISQCGSGVTACHNILAMAVAGMGIADLYVGSWSDWSISGFPIATGDEPG